MKGFLTFNGDFMIQVHILTKRNNMIITLKESILYLFTEINQNALIMKSNGLVHFTYTFCALS